jgi:prefoldin subunit 5
MGSEQNDFSEMFEDFVEETNKKISRLEAEVKILADQIKKLETETKVINVSNLQVKGSLGDTIKTVGDLSTRIGKNWKR